VSARIVVYTFLDEYIVVLGDHECIVVLQWTLLLYLRLALGWLWKSDLDVLMEELSPVKSKWKQIASKLKVSLVEASHPSDGLHEVLRVWLTQNVTHWGDVVAALRSIGEDSLCSELKVKYGELLSTESSMFGQVYEGLDVKMIVQLP